AVAGDPRARSAGARPGASLCRTGRRSAPDSPTPPAEIYHLRARYRRENLGRLRGRDDLVSVPECREARKQRRLMRRRYVELGRVDEHERVVESGLHERGHEQDGLALARAQLVEIVD